MGTRRTAVLRISLRMGNVSTTLFQEVYFGENSFKLEKGCAKKELLVMSAELLPFCR